MGVLSDRVAKELPLETGDQIFQKTVNISLGKIGRK
jgi:hypothetical protein